MYRALRDALEHYLCSTTTDVSRANEDRLRTLEYGTSDAPKGPHERAALYRDKDVVRDIMALLNTSEAAVVAWLGRHVVAKDSGIASFVTRRELESDPEADAGRPYSLFRRAWAYCSLYEFAAMAEVNGVNVMNNSLQALLCNLHILEEAHGVLANHMEWSIEQACGAVARSVRGVTVHHATSAAKAILRMGAAKRWAHEVS